jgi:hypothetical protein
MTGHFHGYLTFWRKKVIPFVVVRTSVVGSEGEVMSLLIFSPTGDS